MTVLAAIRDGNKVYVGTDSRWQYENGFKFDIRHKFIETSVQGLVIAAAGDDGVHTIFEEALKTWEKTVFDQKLDINTESIKRLAEMTRGRIIAAKPGEAPENELPAHEFGFILAYRDSIWVMECKYNVFDASDIGFAAEGAGAEIAYVAHSVYVETRKNISPKHMLKRIIGKAIQWHNTCGGDIHIRRT